MGELPGRAPAAAGAPSRGVGCNRSVRSRVRIRKYAQNHACRRRSCSESLEEAVPYLFFFFLLGL